LTNPKKGGRIMKNLERAIISIMLIFFFGCTAAHQSSQTPRVRDVNPLGQKEVIITLKNEKENALLQSGKGKDPNSIPSHRPLTEPPMIPRNVSIFQTHVDFYFPTYIGMGDLLNFFGVMRTIEEYTNIKDIMMVMISVGGNAFAGHGWTEAIAYWQSKGFKFTALAIGMVASAAVPVYSACDVRLSTAKAKFMVHQASIYKRSWSKLDTSDAKSDTALLEMIEKDYKDLLSAHTNMKPEDWEPLIERTTWIEAIDAKKMGLVQKIVN
jgi:ATP-dependent protease ClpP protease subunit